MAYFYGNYEGNDNYGRPKSEYLKKLTEMDDEKLYLECYGIIYQAARCSNNPRADWHWMADACYDETSRRDKREIYDKAWKNCVADNT